MLETPSDLAIKISLLHDEVDSDGTFSPPIRRIEQLVAVRDAEVQKKCADRAIAFVIKEAAGILLEDCYIKIDPDQLRAAIIGKEGEG